MQNFVTMVVLLILLQLQSSHIPAVGPKSASFKSFPHSGHALGIVDMRGRPRTAHAGMFL